MKMNMTMKMNKINRFLAGGVLCLSAAFLSFTEVSAYTSVYFDSSIDTRNWQMVVVKKNQDEGDSEYRGEEEYVRESTCDRVEGYNWVNRYEPSSGKDEGYVPLRPDVFVTWKRDNIFGGGKDIVSKKLTVPAMKLHVKGDKTHVNYLGKDEYRALVLEDAIMAYQRESSPNLSMVNGLNQILKKIETLKGGYKDIDDFKATLMALGYLFSGQAGGSVKISIEPPGEEVKEKADNETVVDEKNEPQENLKPTDPNYKGTGEDIIVRMTGGAAWRTVTVEQSGEECWKENMLIMAYTGYEVTSIKKAKNPTPETIEMKIEGKTATYTNSNKLSGVTIDPGDIKTIKLTSLIEHALIKAESGVTAVSGEGQMSGIEKMVYDLIDVLLSMFEDNLGLVALEELVYNASGLEESDNAISGYELGMYPRNWQKLISTVFSFVGIISVSMLVFSVIRVFYRMTLDSMNVGKRVELKEDIAEIIQTVVTMLAVVFVFRMLAYANYTFVNTVYNALGGGSISFMSKETLSAGGIGNVILRIVMVYIRVYVNVLYVVRSLNIALLLALTPAFVTAIAFGKKQFFETYVKELLGSLFLQSFHAIIFLFIFEAQTYLNTGEGATSAFVSVVLAYTILPTTKMFKSLLMPSALMEVGQQLGDKFGQKAKQTGRRATAMATGGTAAVGALAGGAVVAKGIKKLNETAQKGESHLDKINQYSGNIDAYNKAKGDKGFNYKGDEDRINAANSMSSEDREAIGGMEDLETMLGEDVEKEINKGLWARKVLNTIDKTQTRGGALKKGAQWAKMNQEREAAKESQSKFNSLMQDKTSGQFGEGIRMAKTVTSTPGVYDISSEGKEDFLFTKDAIQNLGFRKADKVKGGSDNEFMLEGIASDIDRIRVPSRSDRANMVPEMQMGYEIVEIVQKARRQISEHEANASLEGISDEEREKSEKEAEKIRRRTEDHLRRNYGVTQEGLLNNVNDDNVKSSLRMPCRDGFGVKAGMQKECITVSNGDPDGYHGSAGGSSVSTGSSVNPRGRRNPGGSGNPGSSRTTGSRGGSGGSGNQGSNTNTGGRRNIGGSTGGRRGNSGSNRK